MTSISRVFLRIIVYFWIAVAGALTGFIGTCYLFMELFS